MKWLAGLALAACGAAAQPASYLTPEAALNKAGRQRMLAEYIVKEYLQVSEGVSGPGARGHLNDAITVFEDQLSDLKDFAQNPELRASVADLERRWVDFRGIATSAPSRRAVAALRESGLLLYEAAERNTAALERLQARPGGRLIALSGRQRMLSQRVAKDYLLLAARIDEDAVRQELERSREEFEAAHSELAAAAPTEELRTELASVEKLWIELQPFLRRDHDTSANRARAVELTDGILSRMERITGLFERGATP